MKRRLDGTACGARALQRIGIASGLLIALLAACSEAPSPPPPVVETPPPDDAARAQAAMQELGGSLRSALQAAMMRDGPLGAVDFCHDEAPKIAQVVSEKHGLRVGRTALRHRSLANAPNAWQLPVLQDFQARFESGQPVAELTSMQREGLPEGIALRAMRGIALEPQCQLCHGVEIAPTLAEAIAQRYPGDQATGFSTGDLRGAVWAEVSSATETAAATSTTDSSPSDPNLDEHKGTIP